MGTLLLTICFAAKDIADAVAQALKAIGVVAAAPPPPPPPPPLAPPARVDPAPGAAHRTIAFVFTTMKKNAMPCIDALVEPMRVMLTLTCHDFPVKETQPQIGKLEVLACVWGTSEET